MRARGVLVGGLGGTAVRVVFFALPATGGLSGGCTMRITPPAAPPDPAVVFVVDHGFHSSLLLPDGSGGLTEFAYGEWEWFALGREQWYRVPEVLFWPTQGTLGRRVLGPAVSAAEARQQVAAEAIHGIVVARDRAEALCNALHARIEAAAAERVSNASYGLEMVKAGPRYWIMSHCNTAVAEWLRMLGCRVCGEPLIADFRVPAPRG